MNSDNNKVIPLPPSSHKMISSDEYAELFCQLAELQTIVVWMKRKLSPDKPVTIPILEAAQIMDSKPNVSIIRVPAKCDDSIPKSVFGFSAIVIAETGADGGIKL